MAAATVFASAVSNPGGTGNTLTVTLSTHAADDVLLIYIANTGNALWAGNPAGWSRLDQRAVGTSSNGIVGSWFYRRVLSGDSLPLTNPLFTLGATSTRAAICRTIRGADLEGVFILPEWGQRGFSTGTANPVRPPTVTTLAPEMLVLHCYGQRAATNAPEPTDYTQDQEIIISGTLVLNASQRTVSDQNTALGNQDASPTSGARWAAGILCIPSPDYVYYRSGSQALTASGTSATPALPSGTSSSDNRGNKDLVIATVEAAGTPTISPQVGADWTEIVGQGSTTSGNGTTVRKYWALYDGSLNLQFNRSTTGEIAVCLTTYRNAHQTTPIITGNTRQNASSTTSTWDALTRTQSKITVIATCVADGTPTYTTPSGWIERMDGNGIVCADQAYNAIGSSASASFTLSAASPTLVGLLEIASVSSVAPITVTPAAANLALTTFVPTLQFTTRVTPGSTTLTTTRFAPQLKLQVTPVAGSLSVTGFAPQLATTVTPSSASLSLSTFTPRLSEAISPPAAAVALTAFAPDVVATSDITVTPDSASLTLTVFEPTIVNTTPGYRTSNATSSTFGTGNPGISITPEVGDLLVVYCFVSGNTNDTPTCSDDQSGSYDLIDVANVSISGVDYRLSVFVRTTLASVATLTSIITATGSNTSRTVHVYAFRGMSRAGSGAVRSKGLQSNQSAGTAAPALNQSALGDNITIVAVGSADTSSTPPAGWTEHHDTSTTVPVISLATATRDTGFTGTAITFDEAQDTEFCSHALELDTSAPGVTVTVPVVTLALTGFAPALLTAIIPASAGLSTSTFAPTLITTITPDNTSLTLDTFAPSVTTIVTVPAAALSLTTFAPTVTTTANVSVTPATTSLTLTPFAPSLREVVTPASQALTLTAFAPKLVEVVTPAATSLSLTTFAPVVGTNTILAPATAALTLTEFASILIERTIPPAASLTLSTFAPAITATANVTVTPGVAALTIARFTPSLRERVTPSAASLSLSTFTPDITISADITITPTTRTLALTGFIPALHEQLTPATSALIATTFAPTITISADKTATPTPASLTLQAFTPVLSEIVTPGTATLAVTANAPVLALQTQPTPATLNLSTFAPVITIGGDVMATPPSVGLTLTAYAPTITASVISTPARRTFVVESAQRTVAVEREFREFKITQDEREEMLV